MAKLPEVETQTTVHCGEVAGHDVRIIHDRAGAFVKLRKGDIELTFTLLEFVEVSGLVTAGALKLGGVRT